MMRSTSTIRIFLFLWYFMSNLKENHYPGLFTSDYYSERVGEDMVTLPSKYFTGKDIYISVYCGNKCKYNLFVEFKEMVVINAGQIIGLNMKKDNVFYFKYIHNEINAEHIEILTYTNSYSGKYKMYVGKSIIYLIFRYCSYNKQYSNCNTFYARGIFCSY